MDYFGTKLAQIQNAGEEPVWIPAKDRMVVLGNDSGHGQTFPNIEGGWKNEYDTQGQCEAADS